MRGLALLALLAVSGAHAAQATDPVTCMAFNVYYESAGESFDGRVAVAAVTLNRAEGDAKRICGVVYLKARNPNTGKLEAAFSWTLGAAWRARGPVNARAMSECELIARAVIAGELHSRFDSSVKHYHTLGVAPHWRNRFVMRIGNHLFYRG
jgi:spore germination cell wall hydrolase CwlJ-like protein